MTGARQDQDNFRDKEIDEDGLDRILDLALAKYAAVAPREGLENRILGNLQAQRGQVPNRAGHRWYAMAAVAAVAVVVMTLAWRSGKNSHTSVANQPTATAAVKASSEIVSNSSTNEVRAQGPKRTPRAMKRRAYLPAEVAAQPKLDQFPSPQPLSEQEKILASYVAEDPERAILVARLRTELLRQDELEEIQAFPSGDRDVHSENSGTAER
jgi:hypothetical protein